MSTSLFSIYIHMRMLYEQYKANYFAIYIESEAEICTAKRGVFNTEWRKNYLKLLEEISPNESRQSLLQEKLNSLE